MDAVRMEDVSTGLLVVCTRHTSIHARPEEACFMRRQESHAWHLLSFGSTEHRAPLRACCGRGAPGCASTTPSAGQPRRGSGPAVQGRGGGGGGGGQELSTGSLGQLVLPCRPRLDTSILRGTPPPLSEAAQGPSVLHQVHLAKPRCSPTLNAGTPCPSSGTSGTHRKWLMSSLKEMATLVDASGGAGVGAQHHAARRQDDVLHKGDVKPAVALDADRPREVGEADLHRAVGAQVAAAAARAQVPAGHAQFMLPTPTWKAIPCLPSNAPAQVPLLPHMLKHQHNAAAASTQPIRVTSYPIGGPGDSSRDHDPTLPQKLATKSDAMQGSTYQQAQSA